MYDAISHDNAVRMLIFQCHILMQVSVVRAWGVVKNMMGERGG